MNNYNLSPRTLRMTTFGGAQYALIPDGIDDTALEVALDWYDQILNTDSRTISLIQAGGCDIARITKSGIVSVAPHQPDLKDILPGEMYIPSDAQGKPIYIEIGGLGRVYQQVGDTWFDLPYNEYFTKYPVVRSNLVRVCNKYGIMSAFEGVLK